MANVNDESKIGNEIDSSFIREEMYRMVALSVDKHSDFLYRLMLDENGELDIICLPMWSSRNICAGCREAECCCKIDKICLHSVQGSDYEEIDREDGTDNEDIAQAFVDQFIDMDEILKMARTFLAGDKNVPKQFTGLKNAKLIIQLHDEKKTVREIAEAVGLSKTTIHRHLMRHANQK